MSIQLHTSNFLNSYSDIDTLAITLQVSLKEHEDPHDPVNVNVLTISRALRFMYRVLFAYNDIGGDPTQYPMPCIAAAGSNLDEIDLFWSVSTSNKVLLINFTDDFAKKPTYSAQVEHETPHSAALDLSKLKEIGDVIPWELFWVAEDIKDV